MWYVTILHACKMNMKIGTQGRECTNEAKWECRNTMI